MAKKQVIGRVMVSVSGRALKANYGSNEQTYTGSSIKEIMEKAVNDNKEWSHTHCVVQARPRKCPSGTSVCADGHIMCDAGTVYFTGGRTNQSAENLRTTGSMFPKNRFGGLGKKRRRSRK